MSGIQGDWFCDVMRTVVAVFYLDESLKNITTMPKSPYVADP